MKWPLLQGPIFIQNIYQIKTIRMIRDTSVTYESILCKYEYSRNMPGLLSIMNQIFITPKPKNKLLGINILRQDRSTQKVVTTTILRYNITSHLIVLFENVCTST